MTYPHRDFKMILNHPCSPLSVDWGGIVHGDGQLCVAASLEREVHPGLIADYYGDHKYYRGIDHPREVGLVFPCRF